MDHSSHKLQSDNFCDESLCTEHDVAKSKYVHQVTAKSLHTLRKSTFNHYKQQSTNQQSFEEWRDEMETNTPQFRFWSIALKLEVDYLLFIQSIRSFNFTLYVVCQQDFTVDLNLQPHPLYLLADHSSLRYGILSETNPVIFKEFISNGNFTVRRTK